MTLYVAVLAWSASGIYPDQPVAHKVLREDGMGGQSAHPEEKPQRASAAAVEQLLCKRWLREDT